MVKYLGVTIDKKLSFEHHIKNKCKSARTILNMLRRNLYFAPKSVKQKAYQACVLPIIEYASTCWSPNSDKMNNAIEMVQHDAARFITNTTNSRKHSITKILNYLNFDTLEERRTKAKLLMAYKIINGHVILEPNMLPKNQRPMRECNAANVGKENQLIESSGRLQVIENTFFYFIPKIWNQRVTPAQAKAPSIDAFKANISKK